MSTIPNDQNCFPQREISKIGDYAAEQAGVLLSAGEQFVTRQTTAPHAVRLCVNSEYGLNRYLDGISTLAELLRNPD